MNGGVFVCAGTEARNDDDKKMNAESKNEYCSNTQKSK